MSLANQQRASSTVEQRADAIQAQISVAIQTYGRCAMPFSGSFESCLLLHLAQPWKDQIVAITLDTGATFSHVEGFLDRALGGWNRRVVRTEVRRYLEREAVPSRFFSLAAMLRSPLDLSDIRTGGGKQVVSDFDCCRHNRGLPGQRALKELNVRAVINDRTGGDQDTSLDGVAHVSPLRTQTRAEIQEMITAFGIEVPDYYPEFDAPHGCSICPAALTVQRQIWMAKLYPDDLIIAGSFSSEEAEAFQAAMARDRASTAAVFHLNRMERV
jgi:3'-phosphoadenosine 5'-phosphosulfate sulfotransferase (PAPS reductase)/FAD synthetase